MIPKTSKVNVKVDISVQTTQGAARARRPIVLRTAQGEANVVPPEDVNARYEAIIKTKRPGAPGVKQKELHATVMQLMAAAYEQGWDDAKATKDG